MKELKDFEEEIHKCSKCGLCQGVCPIYNVTGNECSVSRGQFIMLKGLINGDLKMTKKLNHYLDLCLKCGKCSEFCPSGIDVVDIIVSAQKEYFETHFFEKIVSFIQKYFIFGAFPNFAQLFAKKTKSKNFTPKVTPKFTPKVIYFGGCNSKYTGNASVIKIMNSAGIEVITPNFSCCGIPFFVRGDFKSFENYMNNYIKILKKYNVKKVVTTCASCEKTLKNYIKWCNDEDKEFLSEVIVKNIYEYLRENEVKLKLKKPAKVTYHKPCNQNNYEDIKYVLNNTENLEYFEADGYDKCCGLNGIFKFNEYEIMSKICNEKRNSIISAGVNKGIRTVLTSCFGCETALRLYSFGKYRTANLTEFLGKNL